MEMQCKMQIQNSICICRLKFIGQKRILCKTIFHILTCGLISKHKTYVRVNQKTAGYQ